MVDFIIENIEKNKIIEMLKEEERVRYSPQIQEVYTEQYHKLEKNKNESRLNIELEIQKFILKQFGYSTSDVSINNYHKIPSKYFHDDDIKNSIFYIKLNIFKYPSVHVGDDLINVELIDYSTKNYTFLNELTNSEMPLIILAGSMT
jgi:hypothetical protein